MNKLKITQYTGIYTSSKKHIKLFPSRLTTEDIQINLDEKFNYLWYYSNENLSKSLIKYPNAYIYVIDRSETSYSCCGEIIMYYAETLENLDLTEQDITLIEKTGLEHLKDYFFFNTKLRYFDFVEYKIKEIINEYEKDTTLYYYLQDTTKIVCGYPFHLSDVKHGDRYKILCDIMGYIFIQFVDKNLYGYILDDNQFNSNTLTYSNNLYSLLLGIPLEDKYYIIKRHCHFKQEQYFIRNYYKTKYKELYNEDLDLLVNEIYMSIDEFKLFDLKNISY
jgi:hypothetical protein